MNPFEPPLEPLGPQMDPYQTPDRLPYGISRHIIKVSIDPP